MLGAKFEEALVFASILHKYQTRKRSSTPYIAHLLSVTAIVLENGGGESEAIAALLHDAIEDQSRGEPDLLRGRIRAAFGEDILRIVEGCSDTDETIKPAWRPRKERFIEKLKAACSSICLVVAADKLHNMRTILADLRYTPATEVWQRFNSDKQQQAWYYEAVCAAVAPKLARNFAQELARTVTELKAAVMNSDGNSALSRKRVFSEPSSD